MTTTSRDDDRPEPYSQPVRRQHTPHVQIIRQARSGRKVLDDGALVKQHEWRWQLHAGNGQPIITSAGFLERRKLVRNLERVTGKLMLDQDRGLVGPSWYLWGVDLAFPGAQTLLDAGKDTSRWVQGVVWPILVPKGTGLQWTSRVRS